MPDIDETEVATLKRHASQKCIQASNYLVEKRVLTPMLVQKFEHDHIKGTSLSGLMSDDGSHRVKRSNVIIDLKEAILAYNRI